MAVDYSRIHRLLKILMHIQGEKGWTARRLAVECGTTERNIYRDLKMLEGAGVPYSFDKETNGYIVRRDFFMPAVEMTLDESLAVLALAEQIGGEEQVPFTRAAAKAISKIRCNLPQPIQQELKQIEEHIAIRLAAISQPQGTEDVYQLVRRALAQRRVLECRYESVNSGGKDVERFRFKPYTLLFNQRAWYAVGHHGGRGEVRTLKLNRFNECRLTNLTYEIPKGFSVAKYLGNAWRMIRGDKSYDVELRFDPEFAETVADTHWHPTQEVLWQDDGSIIFRCTVDGLDEIVWWILSMGPHCTVNKPPELAERVRGLAAGIVSQYETPQKVAGKKPKKSAGR
ncbi:MAG: helix-turn-helix transcriptional regulator [Tepidisphaerales bacterium]